MLNTYLASRTTDQLKEELRICKHEIEAVESLPISKMDYETSAYLTATYESYDAIDKEIDRRILAEIEKTLPQPTSIRRVS